MLIVLLFISRSKVNEIVVLLEISVEASVGEVELIVKDRSRLFVLLPELVPVSLSESVDVILFVVDEGSEQLSKNNMLTKERNM